MLEWHQRKTGPAGQREGQLLCLGLGAAVRVANVASLGQAVKVGLAMQYTGVGEEYAHYGSPTTHHPVS